MASRQCKQSATQLCGTCQALEYVNKQGGLPVAARYLARAVALPPSNTSWYMGLSNGAAGLCEPPAARLNPILQNTACKEGCALNGAWPYLFQVRRAVDTDSSTTSLIASSAHAGDLQAIVVSNPKVAAAVAEICMVGLAATVQATKGPPKPDKARIDRLAYVVSEPRLSL